MATSTAKRRRLKRRIDEDGDPEFQVAPMVDVLLVLMLFFMAITSTEVLQKDKNLVLAEANHAKQDKEKKHPDELVVNVSWENETAGFSMDGLRYPTADTLEAVLAQRHQQNPRAYVLIRADKNAEYSNISDVMTACAAAGIATVSFAVISNPNQKSPAPAAPAGGT